MGRELVERPDDGTWWIVETVTEPKMRISRVFTSKAEALTALVQGGLDRRVLTSLAKDGVTVPEPERRAHTRNGHRPSSPSSGDDSFKSKSHSFKRKNGHDSHAKEGTSHASGDAQVDEALLRVGALEVENWAHEDCLHPEYLPRNKLRSESAAIRKAMEALRKKSSHHRIRILAFIQMFVATLILTAIWAVQTNGGKA